MSTESKLKPVRGQTVFAPPPLLEGEDEAAYDELIGRVYAAVKRVDVIAEMLIADVAAQEWQIARWRRWKAIRLRECGLAALQDFLCRELAYPRYRKRFADDLTEILQESLPADQARTLANACAGNEMDAVAKVEALLTRIGPTVSSILDRAKADKAEDLAHKYRRREPAAVKAIDNCSPRPAQASTRSWLRPCPRNSIPSSGSLARSRSPRIAVTPTCARSSGVRRSSAKRWAKACQGWRTTSLR